MRRTVFLRRPAPVIVAVGMALGLLFFVGRALWTRREAPAPTQTVGNVRIAVANTPDPPRVGDNMFTLRVWDASGRPVHGARVETIVSMPAMGAMPYMESRGVVTENKLGVYRSAYGLAMAGEWDVLIRVRPPQGGAVESMYRLSTSTHGLAFVGGTAAAGASTAAETAATPLASSPTGAITVESTRRQELGIRTERIGVRDLATTIRVTGRVDYSERRQAEVALKFGGWVREMRADFTGRPVRAGEVLFTVYSPELYTTEREYLDALHAEHRGDLAADLAAAARERLALWGISSRDIAVIARSGRPRYALPITAPVSGIITEKSIVQGSAFTAGQVLYRIAPLDPVWVLASVYQMDAPNLRLGMPATIHMPSTDAPSAGGRVSYLAPSLATDTRTLQVRIEVPNPRGRLRPGMFVTVELETPRRPALAVPASAVVPTGERNIVFVDVGAGRLTPRDVQLGPQSGDYYPILGGLSAGDVVVTSGNFLIAAESKLRSAGGTP
jgi:Cu(I)/Ag(I) efflux system membrane fusion protein